MKVVINNCFGGFGLSFDAMMLYAKYKGFDLYAFTEAKDASGKVMFGKQKFVSVQKGDKPFITHYAKKPLIDGKPDEKSYFSERDIKRDDPLLIRVVEELKDVANAKYAKLKVVEIPYDVKYKIDEYDGNESIHEVHRSWS